MCVGGWWGMTGALLLLGPRLVAGGVYGVEGVVRDDKTASASKAKQQQAAPLSPLVLYLQANNTHHMPSVVDAEKESPRLLRTVFGLVTAPPTMGMADSC